MTVEEHTGDTWARVDQLEVVQVEAVNGRGCAFSVRRDGERVSGFNGVSDAPACLLVSSGLRVAVVSVEAISYGLRPPAGAK